MSAAQERVGSGGAARLPVTVVVAAFDLTRWPLLQSAVRSVQGGQRPGVEVVVSVDNNAALYDRVRRELPGVTAVHHSGPPGAGPTRNAGAAVAKGPLLAFLDDDAEAQPAWLDRLLRPLEDRDDVLGVGGGVLPSWQTGAPRWFPMEFGWVVGASYIGQPVTGAAVRNVWGENMALRSADFHAAGGFRAGFGKVGRVSRPEDTELCLRLQAAHPAASWWYEPAAVVRHAVPGERATGRFFLRRCLAEGRGKAALRALAGAPGMTSERAHVRTVLPAGVLRGLRAGTAGDPYGPARAAMILAGTAAAAVGWLLERHGVRAAA